MSSLLAALSIFAMGMTDESVATVGAEEKLLMVEYDLSPFLDRRAKHRWIPGATRGIQLRDGSQRYGVPSRPLFDAEQWIGFVSSSIDPEVWELGGDLHPHRKGMFVVAPEATQAKLEALLSVATRATNRSARLAVTVYEGELPQLSESVLSEAEVDQLIDTAQSSGKLRQIQRATTDLTSSGVSQASQLVERTALVWFHSAIADSVGLALPHFDEFDTGLIVGAHGQLYPTGTWVDLAVHSSVDLEPRVLSVVRDGMHIAGNSFRMTGDSLDLDVPHDEFALWTCPLWIPEGQAVLLSVTGEDGASHGRLVEVRVENRGDVPAFDAIDVKGPLSAVALRLGPGVRGDVRHPEPGNQLLLSRGYDPSSSEESGAYVTALPMDEHTLSLDGGLLAYLIDPALAKDGAFVLTQIGGSLVGFISDDLVERAAEVVDELTGPRSSYSLAVSIHRSDERVASFSVPVTEGRTSSVWAGEHYRLLGDWDHDVSNHVSVGRPEFESELDGYSLAFDLREANGALRLGVSGFVSLVQGDVRRREIDQEGEFLEEVTKVSCHLAEQEVAIEPSKTIVISGDLRLELTLQ